MKEGKSEDAKRLLLSFPTLDSGLGTRPTIAMRPRNHQDELMEPQLHPRESNDLDRRFFERELASFVPDRIFDAHCHLWSADHYRAPFGDLLENVGYREYFELI